MTDVLAQRRTEKAKLKEKYQSSVDKILDPVIAAWQEYWVEDCREKGKLIPFAEWCLVPLNPNDPMSSPFEIANVYTEDTFRK